jgi:flagellar hook-associated protein 3 FlgL
MRVTGSTNSFSILAQLNSLAARQSRLQIQAGSGQRIAAPGDDPWAAGTVMGLQTDSTRLWQYAKNILSLQERADSGQDAVQALKSVIDRAGELAVQADGTRPADQIKTFAIEVNQLIERALQVANRKEGRQHLFSGTGGGQPPFEASRDASGQIVAITYHGNASAAFAEIGENALISIDAPGQNDSGDGPRGLFADTREGADLFGHLIALRDHLAAGDTAAIASQDREALLKDEQNIISHAANFGALKARLDAAEATLQSRDAGLQEAIAGLAGADLGETIVHLTQTQNAYQLALQSSAKLLQLQQSLLSYL